MTFAIALGGGQRDTAIVGAVASLGLLVAEPVARWLRATPPLQWLPDGPAAGAVAAGVMRAAVVLGTDSLAGLQTDLTMSIAIAAGVLGVVPSGPVPAGVRVLGRVPRAEMSRQYREADALVIPTHMEAFGIAILEALLHGTPCIGGTVGNQPRLIVDAGICVEPGRTAQVESAIHDISANYPQCKAAAHRRRDILARVMNWDVVAERMFESLS